MQLALASGALALPTANSETPESVPVGVMSSMLKQDSGLGLRGLGFRGLGFRGLGFRGLGV